LIDFKQKALLERFLGESIFVEEMVHQSFVKERARIIRVEIERSIEELSGPSCVLLIEKDQCQVVEHLEGGGTDIQGGLEKTSLGTPLVPTVESFKGEHHA